MCCRVQFITISCCYLLPIFILASQLLSANLHGFAHTLFVSFVTNFSELFGPEIVTYNVHELTVFQRMFKCTEIWTEYLDFHLRIIWVKLKG